MPLRLRMPLAVSFLALLPLLFLVACSNSEEKVFYIGGIPDQDVSVLEARFNGLARYLSQKTGLKVQYLPSIDYALVVTAFKQGDIQMAWYGGLTGVQARLAVPNAQAIAQRPRDAEFHSVFVANPKSGITSLADVKGKRFTFGSESSTSGHLMPRFFLTEAGVNPDKDLDGPPGYSGSHDITWKQVEAGTYQAGALNEAVWEARLKTGDIGTSKVDVFYRTPAYYDYHWVIRGDVDDVYGKNTLEKIRDALLQIDASKGGKEKQIAEVFYTDKFIPTTNENYAAIEQIARQLGIIEP